MSKRVLAVLVVVMVMLVGCSNGGAEDRKVLSEEDVVEVGSATVEPEVTKGADIGNAEVEDDLSLPLLENTSGKVLIQTVSGSSTYPYTSYIITSSEGETVVVDPTKMPKKESLDLNPAAIVITHAHPDHIDQTFIESYESKKILFEKAEIETKNFHIYSMLSSHSGDTIEESSRNVIIVFEVDGLRIAHMGDVGQTVLTEEQLKELGKIDIAFMQFENSYSDMSLENEKGFKLMEQLKPNLIIPTHYSDAALPILEEKYGAITEFENFLAISKEDLPKTELSVYRILNNHKY